MTDANESRSIHVWSAADGKVHRVTDELFNEESPGLGPRGRVPLLPLRPGLRAPDQHLRVELRDEPHDRDLRRHPEEGRQEPLPAAVGRGDLRGQEGGGRGEGGREEARGRGRTKDAKAADAKAEGKGKPEKKETPFRIDFEGLGSRVTRVPIEGDNINGLAVGKGHLLYTVTGAPFYGRDSYAKPTLKLYSLQGPQGVDAGRERDRLGPLPRRGEGPGPPGGQVQPLRREARGQGQEGGLHQGPDGGPRARRGVAAVLRRGLAPLPRLLLRRRTCTATTGRRSATATGRSCPTSPTAPTSTTSSARWWPS